MDFANLMQPEAFVAASAPASRRPIQSENRTAGLTNFQGKFSMIDLLYRWRWGILVVYVIAWTAALLMPVPVSGAMAFEGMPSLRMLFAKSLHAAAYAVLAMLTAWVRVPSRYRWLMMMLLMAHPTITEMLQLITEPYFGRNGNLLDVALDQVGIAVGVIMSRRWWMERS
jgi:VanZ family protein